MSRSVPLTGVAQEQPRVWALVSLFLAPAFVFANMYSTQAILPVLSNAFHVSAPTAGLSISVLVLAVAIGSLIYGPISDRIGRKPVMVSASLLVVIPTLLLGFSPNFATLIILRAAQGLLMPGLTSVAISYVNEEFSGKGRGLAMGVYVSGLTLGGLFARSGSAALAGIFTYLPYYLTGPHFRLPTISLGLVYLLWLTGVCSPFAGTIAARIGSRRALAFSLGSAIVGLLITLIPILPFTLFGLGLLTVGMFSTVPAANLYLGEKATTARGTAASLYLSLYYFGGSLGAVLPGFALLLAGWPGVVLLCLCTTLIALASDAVLCR